MTTKNDFSSWAGRRVIDNYGFYLLVLSVNDVMVLRYEGDTAKITVALDTVGSRFTLVGEP